MAIPAASSISSCAQGPGCPTLSYASIYCQGFGPHLISFSPVDVTGQNAPNLVHIRRPLNLTELYLLLDFLDDLDGWSSDDGKPFTMYMKFSFILFFPRLAARTAYYLNRSEKQIWVFPVWYYIISDWFVDSVRAMSLRTNKNEDQPATTCTFS